MPRRYVIAFRECVLVYVRVKPSIDKREGFLAFEEER